MATDPLGEAAGSEAGVSKLRLAVAVAFPTIAAAVMVGGIFAGARGRIDTVVAGLLGVALAYAVSRVGKPLVANALLLGGVIAIGLVVVALASPGNVLGLGRAIAEARSQGSLARPPVPFTSGWQAIAAWVMALVALTATWVAVVVDRPALGIIIPLP